MGEDRAQDGAKNRRRRSRARRGVVLLVGIAAAVSQLQGAKAQTFPVPGQSFQAAICQVLLGVQASVGTNPFIGPALASFLAAFGCTGPTTTVLFPTSTSTHLDCPLPGGGIGPCPTTTIVFPPTSFPPGTFVPSTFVPPPPVPTTLSPASTFVPTTFPPGTFPTSSTISTLPPCPATTTTSPSIPNTTIPCQPAP